MAYYSAEDSGNHGDANQGQGFDSREHHEVTPTASWRSIWRSGFWARGRRSSYSPLLRNELVGEIAAKYHASPAQVLIAWSVRSGFCCLPKSVNPERIGQNLVGASLPLDDEDMGRLRELDCGWRYSIGYCPGFFDCPNAPWFTGSA